MYHMYHIVVSLTTMSPGKRRLTALPRRVSLSRTQRFKIRPIDIFHTFAGHREHR